MYRGKGRKNTSPDFYEEENAKEKKSTVRKTERNTRRKEKMKRDFSLRTVVKKKKKGK